MLARYHIQVTTDALRAFLFPEALAAIIRANLAQDAIWHQINSPEIHFDDCAFEAGLARIERLRAEVAAADDSPAMWQAFGALTHTAQDFYSHSNYCQLWVAARGGYDGLAPKEIEALDPATLNHPGLRSGYGYFPRDAIYYLPGQSLIRRLLPPRGDSHAAMHLDDPSRGPAFPFSLVAARKRTVHEYRRTIARLTARQLAWFRGRQLTTLDS